MAIWAKYEHIKLYNNFIIGLIYMTKFQIFLNNVIYVVRKILYIYECLEHSPLTKNLALCSAYTLTILKCLFQNKVIQWLWWQFVACQNGWKPDLSDLIIHHKHVIFCMRILYVVMGVQYVLGLITVKNLWVSLRHYVNHWI